MKKIFIAAMLLAITFSAFAQSGKDFYNKYSGKEGVSAVYISPSMFRLMNSIPDIQFDSSDVNLGNIIKTFQGMYILDIENEILAGKLASDVEGLLASGKFELLVEAVDGGERVRIYIVSKGETVTDFLMVAAEKGSTSVISIQGEMPFDELEKIIGK